MEVLKTFPSESVNMIMTSPPYWALRDYGVDGQLGLEKTFEEYITKLCDIFDEVKRVLRKDGTCWVNIGDTYAGSMPKTEKDNGKNSIERHSNPQKFSSNGTLKQSVQDKSLCMIPFRFAIEMVNRGWILRNTIIWYKPNTMPQSVNDRFTVDFEYLFFFVKSKKYWFEKQLEEAVYDGRKDTLMKPSGKYKGRNYMVNMNGQSVHENGQERWPTVIDGKRMKNKRTVWKINTKPFSEAHFAVYPEELCVTPIKAGCSEDGTVLDPFMGSGTTAVVARKLGRKYVGIELNPEYIKIAEKRLSQQVLI